MTDTSIQPITNGFVDLLMTTLMKHTPHGHRCAGPVCHTTWYLARNTSYSIVCAAISSPGRMQFIYPVLASSTATTELYAEWIVNTMPECFAPWALLGHARDEIIIRYAKRIQSVPFDTRTIARSPLKHLLVSAVRADAHRLYALHNPELASGGA